MSEFQLLSTEETEALIKLAQKGDEEAKEKLLSGNYPLIKSIVRRFARKNVEYDDVLPDEYLMLTTPKGLWVPDSLKNNLNH